MKLEAKLRSLRDSKYQEFHSKLTPGKDNILGVRVPVQKSLAREIAQSNWQEVLTAPIGYWAEEKIVYGLVIAYAPLSWEEKLNYLVKFIPHIDSWNVCDIVCAALKDFKKEQAKGWKFLQPYLKSQEEYQVRFAVVMLLDHYLTDDYIHRVLACYAKLKHESYYVHMGVAWGISIAYIKYPEITLEFLQAATLDDFTYNKSLQKCRESLRVSPEDKEMLKAMARRATKRQYL